MEILAECVWHESPQVTPAVWEGSSSCSFSRSHTLLDKLSPHSCQGNGFISKPWQNEPRIDLHIIRVTDICAALTFINSLWMLLLTTAGWLNLRPNYTCSSKPAGDDTHTSALDLWVPCLTWEINLEFLLHHVLVKSSQSALKKTSTLLIFCLVMWCFRSCTWAESQEK